MSGGVGRINAIQTANPAKTGNQQKALPAISDNRQCKIYLKNAQPTLLTKRTLKNNFTF